MISFATSKWKSFSVIALAVICFLPATVFAQKKSQEYRTAVYFEEQYSVYAYATVSDGKLDCQVYLQYFPGYSPEAAITGYTIDVNGKALGTETKPIQNVEDKGFPTHFTVTGKVSGEIKKMVLQPHTASGKLPDREIILYDAAAEKSTIAQTAVVNNPVPTDKLNLRIAPNGDAESLRQYYNGVQVEVLAMMPGNWAAVSVGQSGGVARGYMKADYLAFGEDGEAVDPVMPAHTAIVDSWTLYSYPDEESLPVSKYSKGQAFTILARSSAWWHIAVDDVTGFVRADILVQIEMPSASPSPEVTAPLGALEQVPEAEPTDAVLEIDDKPTTSLEADQQ
ncbi:SH3 domain-containing protein [Eubacteriales bacterium OttesenSCG-928-A19]|nr:SH3 domain-containing protein [Eubacteriales bacterium OttesenSCG-928-A19]